MAEDLYYDVIFTTYGNGSVGAPFGYLRSRALVPGCMIPGAIGYNPAANIDDHTCGMERFARPDYVDYGATENQLCLSDAVCLTRARNGQIYNAINADETFPGFQDATPHTDLTLGIGEAGGYQIENNSITTAYAIDGSEGRLERISFNCTADGLDMIPGGREGTRFKFFPNETLADFSGARITGVLSSDPTTDEDWFLNTENNEEPHQVNGSGVIVASQRWSNVEWAPIFENVDADSLNIAIEIVADTTTASDGGVAGEITSCTYSIQSRAYYVWSYDSNDHNLRWAFGKTNYADEACPEEMISYETLRDDCYDASLLTATIGSCNDGSVNSESASACQQPAITTCSNINADTGEGECVLNENYAKNRYAPFMQAIDWPGPQLILNSNYVMSLHDCSTEKFYDVRFLKWTSMNKGGGFELAYAEADPPSWYATGAIHCPVPGIVNGDIIDFVDSDSDGLFDIGDSNHTGDNCPNESNADQTDTDGDGHGDVCDNCPNDANEDQANGDGDSAGTVCDADDNDSNVQ